MKNNEIATIIDMAVETWHRHADLHAQPHCNCYRDMFSRDLIAAGFCGYRRLKDEGELDVQIRPAPLP